jgi:hypothetical protein
MEKNLVIPLSKFLIQFPLKIQWRKKTSMKIQNKKEKHPVKLRIIAFDYYIQKNVN